MFVGQSKIQQNNLINHNPMKQYNSTKQKIYEIHSVIINWWRHFIIQHDIQIVNGPNIKQFSMK